MKILTMSPMTKDIDSMHIFSPILDGLNAAQADCASVMPSVNANKVLIRQLSKVKEIEGAEVTVFCNDPFINRKSIFSELYELGVRSVVNWPSCIFFEQSFKNAMGNIMVSPMREFECLIDAIDAGLEAKAFVLSLNHAKEALSLGIRTLIIHPGLKLDLYKGAKPTLFESIHLMIETLIELEPTVEIYIYQHSMDEVEDHMVKYKKASINISGYVVYGAS